MAFPVIPIIGPLISGLTEIGATYVKGKTKKMEVKAQAEADVMVNASKSTSEWNSIQARNASTSWKDEWITVLFSIPLVLAFVPGADSIVADGFVVLAATPEWYQYTLSVIVAASFGVSKAIGFRNAGKT